MQRQQRQELQLRLVAQASSPVAFDTNFAGNDDFVEYNSSSASAAAVSSSSSMSSKAAVNAAVHDAQRDLRALTLAFDAVRKAQAPTTTTTTTTIQQRREVAMRERVAMFALRARLLERSEQTLALMMCEIN